jgi:hypothetical protein
LTLFSIKVCAQLIFSRLPSDSNKVKDSSSEKSIVVRMPDTDPGLFSELVM